MAEHSYSRFAITRFTFSNLLKFVDNEALIKHNLWEICNYFNEVANLYNLIRIF